MKNLLLFALLTVTSCSFGQTLWQKTEFGMSVDAVQQMYPEAQRPDAKSIANSKYQNGASMLLRISDYMLGSRPYEVQFIFLQERLAKVKLRTVTDSPGIGRMFYTELADRLKVKYGRELSVSPSQFSTATVGEEFTSLWISDKVDILLKLTILGEKSFLEVVYGTELVDEASKL